MLRCAIAGCQTQEKFLRSGSLQILDTLDGDNAPAKKMVWFCESCTKKYIVQGWRPIGEQIRLRRTPAALAVTAIVRVTSASVPLPSTEQAPQRPAA